MFIISKMKYESQTAMTVIAFSTVFNTVFITVFINYCTVLFILNKPKFIAVQMLFNALTAVVNGNGRKPYNFQCNCCETMGL